METNRQLTGHDLLDILQDLPDLSRPVYWVTDAGFVKEVWGLSFGNMLGTEGIHLQGEIYVTD